MEINLKNEEVYLSAVSQGGKKDITWTYTLEVSVSLADGGDQTLAGHLLRQWPGLAALLGARNDTASEEIWMAGSPALPGAYQVEMRGSDDATAGPLMSASFAVFGKPKAKMAAKSESDETVDEALVTIPLKARTSALIVDMTQRDINGAKAGSVWLDLVPTGGPETRPASTTADDRQTSLFGDDGEEEEGGDDDEGDDEEGEP